MIKRLFRRKDAYERERDRSKQNQARLRGTWGYQIFVFGSWTIFNIFAGLAVGALSKIIVYFFVVGKNFILNLFQPNQSLQQFDQVYLNELIRQTLSGQTLLSEISLAVWIPAAIVFGILERRTILDWWRMRQMYSPNTREKSRFATLEEIDRVTRWFQIETNDSKAVLDNRFLTLTHLQGIFLYYIRCYGLFRC